ncbi:glycoside hydrolase family 32 protein [Paenibacillus bouchesdurhonensis]|uniref:glycoside hydrolase family 32 protein n=1 Tax=Paenibacillus bouchesdurhonensis TaxID=1870990 RepID=UPI000DA610F6|nr:glycoside hydrolase family 32 protein [Paenibacillus bouchesdurhonensis]
MTILRTYTLEQANEFIRDSKHLLKNDYRLNYHLMAEFGWMNDPNGFIHYNGEYHLFYQHYPYKPVWGPMHWGHAVSRDLVNWKYHPVALAPDEAYDKGGCFSGSAVAKDGKLVLLYTGHVVTGPNSDQDYEQVQALAISEDGVNFHKHEGNPIIGRNQIPEGVSRKDFRDPKVFEYNNQYYMVLGSNDAQGNGLVLLYRSEDLLSWSFVNILAKSDGTFGDNWECPDLFLLGDKAILMMSPQRMPAQGEQYNNLHSNMYMVGEFDAEAGTFTSERYAQVDHGFDFYAPQSTLDAQGRRIVIGWMDMWEEDMPTQQGHHWAGAMSLPRVAVLDGDRILFSPVEEIESSRSNAYEQANIELSGERQLAISGDSYELQVEFEAGDAQQFGLKLRTDEAGKEETVIAYHQEEGMLLLDRERAGIGPGGQRKAAVPLEDGKLSLRIFVDKSSVEVFAGDGEVVMTARIYPGVDSRGIKLFSTGESQVTMLRKWDISQA